MDSKSKGIFTKINNGDEKFNSLIRKITIGEEIDNVEYAYLLSLAILFYDEYEKTSSNAYLEFSYYLVLNYSLSTKDMKPLLMFSVNNGLYPIAKTIFTSYNIESIDDSLIDLGLEKYRNNTIYEMKSQFKEKKGFLSSESLYKAYIAPTSYGKSNAILDDIKKNQDNKIGIIVPKKALIWQTFRNVKALAKELNYKLLIHDSDYNGEEKFICIFTQERAIRLLQDNDISFDSMYIDEAHNLFEKDERNVLLARLIKLNKKININQRIIFLSPLIDDVANLSLNDEEYIDEFRIDFSIKEFNIFLLNNYNCVEKYNRFVDQFYNTNIRYKDCFDYLNKNCGNKSLIYFNKPRDIEDFSNILLSEIKNGNMQIVDYSNDEDIATISNVVIKYVDIDYRIVDLIRYGIIYIHGKMPDIIKDYLIEKFTKNDKLKYLISNSSILEGVNLSLDKMFIFDVRSLSKNDIMNLVGRVNRLSDVFKTNSLNRLLCDIHFIEYRSQNYKNKISLLRSDEKDMVENPLLVRTKKLDENGEKIRNQENEFIDNYRNVDLKNLFIKNGIINYFYDFNEVLDNIKNILLNDDTSKMNLMELINYCFFRDKNNVKDYELKRLSEYEAIRFYSQYTDDIYHQDLKRKIAYFLNYFKTTSQVKFFIGKSFGEEPSDDYPNDNVYINVKNRSKKDLVNIAVIKSKIEDDFISFKVTKFVKTLYDLEIIDDHIFNKFVYGTDDLETLLLMKMGLSPIIINFINENQLKSEIKINNGMIEVSNKFIQLLEEQDDYIKFEIGKYI